MITIIHGSDIAASRKYFLDERQKYPDAISFDAENVNLTDLAQILSGGGLFSETKNVFIEQFLTKRKKSGDYKDIITYVENNSSENSIFLWENKELDIGTLKAVKQPAIKVFKLPPTLFQLLDELKPGNGKQLINLFHQTIETTGPEMTFFMLIRQTRLLLGFEANQLRGLDNSTLSDLLGGGRMDSSEVNVQIDELKRMQPWQKSKLKRQSELFTVDELLIFYRRLYAIEKGQKTGNLNQSLICAVDFLLLEV